jgi:hypothetical protein
MEGNAWENSTGIREEVRGDEEVEDVGGGTAVVVVSLETRLVVLTDKPASCIDRIRSAMLPPDSFCTLFSGCGARCPLDLEGTCKQIEVVGTEADLLDGSGPLHLS